MPNVKLESIPLSHSWHMFIKCQKMSYVREVFHLNDHQKFALLGVFGCKWQEEHPVAETFLCISREHSLCVQACKVV